MPKSLYDILLDVSKSAMIDEGDLQTAGLLILTAAIHGLNINRAGIWLLTDDKTAIQGKMLIDGDESYSTFGGSLLLKLVHSPANKLFRQM